MKHYLPYVLSFFIFFNFSLSWAQTAVPFQVDIEEVTLPGMPGLQSFVHAQYNNMWLIIGGRTDGLHQRQPFASFAAADNNTMAYVIDPNQNQVWSADLSSLPGSIYEQLQSTNMQFWQADSLLYIIGGYGYSTTANDHITHNKLTAVDMPNLMSAIINATPMASYFQQISHPAMAVSGGYLGYLNQRFYLAGGQKFTGRYNPHGPTHGPGFTQEYTNAIRSFDIINNSQGLSIQNLTEWHDTLKLHRRDYNLAPQIFPDGALGFTMFSGVFQYLSDIPWLNTVDFRDTGFGEVPNFNQYLNQYHTAHMPVYDQSGNAMSTIFFGGMSRYTLDAAGSLVDDINVPFVNTISMVRRYHDGTLQEFKIGEMNGLLGSGAEFIPLEASFVDDQGIVRLNALTNQKTLVGYVVGGIESSQKNIFFTNNGTQSKATTKVFKVYITKNAIGTAEMMDGEEFFTTSLYPNPTNTEVTLDLKLPHQAIVQVQLIDQSGLVVKEIYSGNLYSHQEFKIDLRGLAAGNYLLEIESGVYSKTLGLIKL